MTLREALETLAGRPFHLVQDPVHRLITFEQCAVKGGCCPRNHEHG